jgi:arylsulfatase A-like enzyme
VPTPDIVLIMTDQQRQGFTAADGFPLDTMPFLDSFTAGGARLDHAYTTAPACVPARTSLLTGRWPSAHRVRQNHTADAVIRGGDLLDVLRRNGYTLHFAGKPHMYRGAADFDTFAGPYWHAAGPHDTGPDADFAAWLHSIDHGPATIPTPFALERQFPYRIVDDALDAVAHRDSGRPYFLWVSLPEPHNPYQVPEPYFSLFGEDEVPDRLAGPEAIAGKGDAWRFLRDLVESKRPGYDRLWRRYRASYCGMLRLIDDQLRRLVEALGTADTLFVYCSDHGDYAGDYGLQRKGAGLPEALVRIPMHVVGSGVVAARYEEFVSLADLFPTLCELVGAPIPAGVQGRSLAPLLRGEPVPAAEFDSAYAEGGFGGMPYRADDRPPLHFDYAGPTYDELNAVTQSGTSRMVRLGDWKLCYDVLGRAELYDLATDPAELHNRWDDPDAAAHRARLTERLLRWCLRVADDLPESRQYPLNRPAHNWYGG